MSYWDAAFLVTLFLGITTKDLFKTVAFGVLAVLWGVHQHGMFHL